MTTLDTWRSDAIRSAIDGLDAVAQAMERKWGVGRLRLLVDDELREKFDRQRRKVSAAVWPEGGLHSAQVDEVRAAAEAMKRGWQALDRAATAAGAEPIAPIVWEAATPSGQVLALVRTSAEAAEVAKRAQGRALVVWTLDEVTRVVDQHSLINQAKAVFEGAEVMGATMATQGDRLDDEMPI